MSSTPPPPREGQSHTQGTISVRRAPNAVARCTNIVSDKTGRDIALVCIRGEPDNEWQANAARLVDSWNACLPFPSPATDVPRLVEVSRDMLRVLDAWITPAEEVDAIRERARKILAALLPEVHP